MLFNIQTTYLYVIEHIKLFSTLMDRSYELSSKQIEGEGIQKKGFKNRFYLETYQNLLEEYLDNLYTYNRNEASNINLYKTRVATCLASEHLIEKNILNLGDKHNGKSTINLSSTIEKILKDIYKEKSKPLNKTQYQDFLILIKEYSQYFGINIFSRTTKEIVEKKNSLEELLEEVYSKIIDSINTLEYEVYHNFSKEKTVNNSIQRDREKLKQAQELQDRYITPLYRFTNRNTSDFMQNIEGLTHLLETHKKHGELVETLEYFYLQYMFLVKKIKPLKEYIQSYVRQTETALYRNIGNENLFNKLNTYVMEHSLGKQTKNKLFTFEGKDNLHKITSFFENKANVWKDYNVKNQMIHPEIIDRVNEYVLEQMDNIDLVKETKRLINEEFQKNLLLKEAEYKSKVINLNMQKILKKYLKENPLKNGTDLVHYLEGFLSHETLFKEEWSIGHLQSLTKHFLKTYLGVLKLKPILKQEFYTLKRRNMETTYQLILLEAINE